MKTAPELNGVNITETYGSVDYAPYKAPVYSKVFKGTLAEINIKKNYYLALGYKCNVQDGPGGIRTLTATFEGQVGSDGETPVENEDALEYVWELSPNVVEVDILDYKPMVQSIYPENVNAIKDALINPPKHGYPSWNFKGHPNATEEWQTCSTIWNLIKSGYKTISVNQPLLRKTTTIPLDSSLGRFANYINRIYSLNALIAEGLPSNITQLFLPEPTPPAVSVTQPLTLAYGWKKDYPTIQESTNSTITVTQNWKFGLYSTWADGGLL